MYASVIWMANVQACRVISHNQSHLQSRLDIVDHHSTLLVLHFNINSIMARSALERRYRSSGRLTTVPAFVDRHSRRKHRGHFCWPTSD